VEAIQRASDVRQEHEGGAAEHRVEALIVELELFGVAGNELDVDEVCVGRALPGNSKHLRGDVGADHPPLGSDRSRGGEARLSVPAAHVEHGCARPQLCQLDQLGAVPLPALLGLDHVEPLAPARSGGSPLRPDVLLELDWIERFGRWDDRLLGNRVQWRC
jgi:hypothetical protein